MPNHIFFDQRANLPNYSLNRLYPSGYTGDFKNEIQELVYKISMPLRIIFVHLKRLRYYSLLSQYLDHQHSNFLYKIRALCLGLSMPIYITNFF
jgi:hypothetical protein